MNKDATELAAKAKEYEELKLKAKKALLDAKKSGELEQIANDMEAAQKEIEEKARRTLLNAKRAGELEWIAQGLPGEFEHMNLGVLPMGVQRRKKAPIDLQARNLGGVD